MNNLVYFCIVVAVQIAFFLFLAHKKGNSRDVAHIILHSVVIGVFFGILFDLIFSKYLGIFSYELGSNVSFLLINGALSYGVMIATVWLLKSESFFSFYFWSIGVGVIYELANYVFPVWKWNFGSNFMYQELVVIFTAYFGLAVSMSFVISVVSRERFKYLN